MNDFIVAMITQAAIIEADRIDTYNELNDTNVHKDIERFADALYFHELQHNPFMKSGKV